MIIKKRFFFEQQSPRKAQALFYAEGQGFEPWIPFDRYTHFPGVPLQPLEHLSVKGCKCTVFFGLQPLVSILSLQHNITYRHNC